MKLSLDIYEPTLEATTPGTGVGEKFIELFCNSNVLSSKKISAHMNKEM